MHFVPIVALFVVLAVDAPAPPAAQGGGRDSVRNGAIIGAAVGGAAVAVLAVMACAIGENLSGGNDGCGGALAVGTLIGAGIGAAIGAGVDLLFDRSPFTGPPGTRAQPLRVALRYRVRW